MKLIDKPQQIKLTNLLINLRTDFKMLQSGDWVPDRHSCDASIEVVEQIADILGVQLDD